MASSYISSTPVAKEIPFDNTGSSVRNINLQDVVTELRKQTVYDPEHTVTVLNGELNLSTTSSTLHFLTGTALNFHINLPNATTLFEGQSYIFTNESSASISIRDTSDIEIFELLSDSIAVLFLQDNATSAGVWVGYVVSGFATGIISYNITSSLLFSTVSATDVVITGFSIIPVAGRYAVWFNARMQSSSASATNNWRVYKAGVGLTDSDRGARFGAASTDFPCSTQTVVSVNGVQAIDIRVRRTGGTLSVFDRTVTLIRLGPEA